MVSTSNISAELRADVTKTGQDNAFDESTIIESPRLLAEKQLDEEWLLEQDREFINKELSKVPALEQPFKTEEVEEVKGNLLFKSLRNILSPVIDGLNSGSIPVAISGLGGALHVLDGFVESMNLPKPLKALTYKASVLFSKSLTVLPNALIGVEDLAKNDFVSGFSKIFSLVAKQFQTKPANFSISSGFFPGVQMAKIAIGRDKYEAKNFESFGDNIKFFFSELLGSIKESAAEISQGKNILVNIFKIIVPSGLMSSTVLGSAIIGDEVSTLKAKSLGFARNTSGICGDLWLLMEAYNQAKEKYGAKQAFAKMLESDDFKIGFPFILASFGELINRYTPESIQGIFAQFLCGANEIITASWGALSRKNENLEPEFA